MLSLIVPIFRNQENLARLLPELEALAGRLPCELEVVFVVDGSPDASFRILQETLPSWPVRAQLIELSRNFGSFPAITAGLQKASGEYFAILAADLQEPPELIVEFHRLMQNGEADIVFGARAGRSDPWLSRFLSRSFWALYRRLIASGMPPGGVDVFGCTRQVRDELVDLKEANTNLVALLFWIGFRQRFVPYERRARVEGRSAWSYGRKLRYAVDSIFGFTDLPIRVLLALGCAGVGAAVLAAAGVSIARMAGAIRVLGYTPLLLAIVFFGGLTAMGLGIIGQYLWLSLQNSRRRPNFIVKSTDRFVQDRAPGNPGKDPAP